MLILKYKWLWGVKMNKKKLLDKEKGIFMAIEGFTASLERELELRKPKSEKVTLDSVTTMPTYAFASLALQNESPLQVIKVIEKMKKRYSGKKVLDNETMGFLDAIQGKAYGYIALNTKNLQSQEKFYNLAVKCFNSAKSRGYFDAILDLADLEKKLGDVTKGENTAFTVFNNTNESYTRLGELYYDFSKLVESAIRVLEDKRPLIEDIVGFEYAMRKYRLGSENSVNCKVYYGLALIIEGKKKEGLKMVKANFNEFKEYNKDVDKILFASDAKIFNDNLKLVESRLIKNNIR